MTSAARAKAPANTLESGLRAGPLYYLTLVHAIVDSELRKLRHDPVELLTRAVQPVLWLLIFGQVLAQIRGLSVPGVPYLDFLAPGILAQSVLFAAIFYGIATIWERDLGILHRYLVSPAPRSALVIGKAASAGIRGLSQAVVIYVVSLALGVSIDLHPLSIAGVVVFVFLGSALFATFSLVIACIVKTRERFMGFGQVITMPLFFASNAIYPLSVMPEWLRVLSTLNPLSYEVDGLRTLMIAGDVSAFGLPLDFAVLFVVTAGLIAVATRMYPRMVQ